MNNYIIELSLYPQEFKVQANSAEEAIEKAKNEFYKKNNGKSYYSIESITKE